MLQQFFGQSKTKSRIYWACLIILAGLWLDQSTKQIAHANLPHWGRHSYFGDLLRLQYAENAGAAFSLGATLPEEWRWVIFGFGQGLFLLILMIYVYRNRAQPASNFYGFTLIICGGLGNFLDRLYRDGVVVDFLNVGIGSVRTAIFNVADMFITTGLCMLLYSIFFQSENQKAQIEDELQDELGESSPTT